MNRRHPLLVAACLLLACLLATPAAAYYQPAVNLGFTSFMDGGPPAGPGLYFTQYLQYFGATKLTNPPGVPSATEVNAWISLSQFIYQSDQPLLLGGKWGLDVIVPAVAIDSDILPDAGGLGDILVGPFLQWGPIMGDNGPIFIHRIELQNLLPLGEYYNGRPLNPGSNFYSFNPYWAGTLFIMPKLTMTWRVHYLWNADNSDPTVPGVSETQAGQAIHSNFAMSYEVIPKMLRVGVNGYHFNQISASEDDNGPAASGDDEQVFAIGPGAMLSFSQHTHLFFNAYFETDSDYRPEGDRFNLRLVHHFK